jgi:hypothetical protein
MDIEELRRFFDELPRKIAQASELALMRTAEKIQTDLSTIFKTEGRSHSVDWKDLNPRYLAYKVKKGFSEKKLHQDNHPCTELYLQGSGLEGSNRNACSLCDLSRNGHQAWHPSTPLYATRCEEVFGG